MVKFKNPVFYFLYLNLLQSFASLHEFPNLFVYIQSTLLEKNVWQIVGPHSAGPVCIAQKMHTLLLRQYNATENSYACGSTTLFRRTVFRQTL